MSTYKQYLAIPKKSFLKDHEIIAGIQAGGRTREAAIKRFIERNSYLIPTMCKKMNILNEQSMDCFSDAIVHFIQQLARDKFRGESKLSSYFYRIFYNKCVDLTRRKTTKVVTDDLSAIPSDDSPERRLELKEDFTSLQSYLNSIGEICKKVILDWGYYGYTMEEIANRNDLGDAKKAKDKKYKCLKKMKALLKRV